jgi:F0F1-type ATP synthase assembly protein I
VAPRSRILAFGSSAALVVAGVACGVLVDGLTGQVLLIALVLLGLGGALLLLFLEVGLSEDHERERDQRPRGPG